jgi:hypothetical protein
MLHVLRSKSSSPLFIESLENRAYLSVDLVDTVSLVVPKSGHVKVGSAVIYSVQIVNQGTTLASGPCAQTLSFSPSADGSAPVTLATVTKNIHLKPGAHVNLRMAEKLPVGTYFGVVVIDPANTFGETNITNNTAVSSNSVIVDTKYPNGQGIWSGAMKIKKGYGKGGTYSTKVTVTNENQTTGTFTCSMTVAGYSLSGQGKISPSGAYTASGLSILGKVYHLKGKMKGGSLTFTYSSVELTGSGVCTLQS